MFKRLLLLMFLCLFVVINTEAAVKFSKLSYEELRTFDVSTLNAKENKKYNKALTKALKKRQKIIKRASKKHDKAEKKRIKKLGKDLSIRTYNNTTVTQTEFDPMPVAKGPEQSLGGQFYQAMLGYGGSSFFMRSLGVSALQLYIIDSYSGDWKTWDSARLSGGKDANFTSISREVLDCADNLCKYREHYGITLSKSFLSSWYDTGGNIRFEVRGTSSGHKEVVTIPEDYVYGFIDKINATFDIVDPKLVKDRRAEIDEALKVRPFIVSEDIFK